MCLHRCRAFAVVTRARGELGAGGELFTPEPKGDTRCTFLCHVAHLAVREAKKAVFHMFRNEGARY